MKRVKKWQLRHELYKSNKAHVWRVGELCKAFYASLGEGMIYRVTKINKYVGTSYSEETLTIVPIHGVFVDSTDRRERQLSSAYCTPLSLVDLGTEYAKLGLMIADEARRQATIETEPSRDAAEVSTGDVVHERAGDDDVDDCGLCADISAREPVQ